MTREEVIKVVQETIVERVFIMSTDYTLESTLTALGIGSLDLIEIAIVLEDKLGIEVGNDLGSVKTVGDIVTKVQEYVPST